jgi:uncharacterized membrane protein (UPF0136 family)
MTRQNAAGARRMLNPRIGLLLSKTAKREMVPEQKARLVRREREIADYLGTCGVSGYIVTTATGGRIAGLFPLGLISAVAAQVTVQSVTHCLILAPAVVELYVKVGRMRILSSPKVVESAELAARRMVDTYLVPNKTFLELREMTNKGSIDVLREFSQTCRAEFESPRAQF